jgi:hypothetical protein
MKIPSLLAEKPESTTKKTQNLLYVVSNGSCTFPPCIIFMSIYLLRISGRNICVCLFVKHATAYKEVNISTYIGRVLTLWNSFLSGDLA